LSHSFATILSACGGNSVDQAIKAAASLRQGTQRLLIVIPLAAKPEYYTSKYNAVKELVNSFLWDFGGFCNPALFLSSNCRI
jgi:uncharacterized protein YfiM (DUF2279 family)